MYYSLWVGIDGKDKLDIGISTSDDLENRTPVGRLPIGGGCKENGIGAPGAIVLDGVIHMFYGGSYNCTPQQIGVAVS